MIIFSPSKTKWHFMKFLRFWKSISWFIFILLVTFLPVSGGRKIVLFNHADKIIHLCLFLVFSIFLVSDARKLFHTSIVDKNVTMIVILTGIITGLFTELVQYYFIASRSGSVLDFIADIVGILVGLSLFIMVASKSKS
jgi:VanZ family protein